jgi:two-component system alkaline phosphatase synthesis response regulator PhoP
VRATVLVVDDEPDVRVLCKVNLEFEGYRVLEAGDGEAAIEMANREAPDLILLDLMMPHVNGWDVMKRLKEDEKTANIPIVLLTAMADEASQMRGWEQGILDYVTKPFNPLSLSKYVQAALGPRDEEMESKRREQIIAKLRNMKDPREN